MTNWKLFSSQKKKTLLSLHLEENTFLRTVFIFLHTDSRAWDRKFGVEKTVANAGGATAHRSSSSCKDCMECVFVCVRKCYVVTTKNLWAICSLFLQLLHINSTNEAYMLQRPSSLFWCHNLTSFSCLEISSVTLTPMSSPDSSISAGVLTPPPSKPALPKPLTGAGLPRPRVIDKTNPNILLFFFNCVTNFLFSFLCYSIMHLFCTVYHILAVFQARVSKFSQRNVFIHLI